MHFNHFISIISILVKESNCKPNKIWVDKGSEFYLRSWLESNKIKIYITHNERKSVVAERFSRTIKNITLIPMTIILKISTSIKYQN